MFLNLNVTGCARKSDVFHSTLDLNLKSNKTGMPTLSCLAKQVVLIGEVRVRFPSLWVTVPRYGTQLRNNNTGGSPYILHCSTMSWCNSTLI